MATIPELYEAIKNRECILFLGAGVHYPPPPDSPDYQYPVEQRPALGEQLSQKLASECRRMMLETPRTARSDDDQLKRDETYLAKHAHNLQRVSWFYEQRHQRKALVELVSREVNRGKQPSAVVRALAELDFPIVITTNYDQLFEQASARCSKMVSRLLVYEPEQPERPAVLPPVPRRDQDDRWLLKLHGCVSRPETIVITDEDYIRFVMRATISIQFHRRSAPGWLNGQRFSWATAWSTTTCGSCFTLCAGRSTLPNPATFSIDLHPDPLIFTGYGADANKPAQEPLVSFIVQDIWTFIPELYQEIKGLRMPA